MAPEFFRHRPSRSVRTVFIICGDLRKFVTVGAPSTLKREGIQRKDHDAAAEVVVRDVDLIRGLVDSNFFDAAHNHGRRRRILLSEGRLLNCCLRRRLGIAPTATAALACAPLPSPGTVMNPATGPALPWPGVRTGSVGVVKGRPSGVS